MMTPQEFNTTIIYEGLEFLRALNGPAYTPEAARFLLCVAMQESGPKLDARYQNSPSSSPGPARGWWQFEQGGGVTGVLTHGVSSSLARSVCQALHVQPNQAAVWRALEGHDVLACCFARLLLFTDPQPIPTREDTAWDCYCNRLWRPGRPHRDMWVYNWATANETIQVPTV